MAKNWSFVPLSKFSLPSLVELFLAPVDPRLGLPVDEDGLADLIQHYGIEVLPVRDVGEDVQWRAQALGNAKCAPLGMSRKEAVFRCIAELYYGKTVEWFEDLSLPVFDLALEVQDYKSVLDEGRQIQNYYVRGTVNSPFHLAGKEATVHLRKDAGWWREEGFRQQIGPGTLVFALRCVPQRDEGTGAVRRGHWSGASFLYCGNASDNAFRTGVGRVFVEDAPARKAGKRGHVDLLQPQLAERIENLDDFHDFVGRFMSGVDDRKMAESSANCCVRLISPGRREALVYWIYSARVRIQAPNSDVTFTIPGSAQATWEEAVVQGKQAQGFFRVLAVALGMQGVSLPPEQQRMSEEMASKIRTGALVIEMIPGERLRLLGSVLDELDRPDSYPALAVQNNVCQYKKKTVAGFIPLSLVVRFGQGMRRSDAMDIATQIATRIVISDNPAPAVAAQLIETANLGVV